MAINQCLAFRCVHPSYFSHCNIPIRLHVEYMYMCNAIVINRLGSINFSFWTVCFHLCFSFIFVGMLCGFHFLPVSATDIPVFFLNYYPSLDRFFFLMSYSIDFLLQVLISFHTISKCYCVLLLVQPNK